MAVKTACCFTVQLRIFGFPKIKTGGIVAVEIGEGQETDVTHLFTNAGVEQIQFEKDSGNIVRVVAGIKS